MNMHAEHRSDQRSAAAAGGADERIRAALTDLSAYALTLERERHRVGARLGELAESDSSLGQRLALVRERDEIEEEISALRQAITALRDQAL
jgi:hypothetical protein